MLHITKLSKLKLLQKMVKQDPNSTEYVIAYKYVDELDRSSPIQRPVIIYKLNKRIRVKTYNINNNQNCGTGINVATYDWCRNTSLIKRNKKNSGYIIIKLKFRICDIVAIPSHSSLDGGLYGKFRIKQATVIS
jgi:hypothetical protein